MLVTSQRDLASQTIKDVLIHEHGFEETGEHFEGSPVYSCDRGTLLITTERDLIFAGHLEEHFHPDVFIFCSRHRSESGRPALLVHSTGNLTSDAEYGGNPREVSCSVASLVAVALQTLHEQRDALSLDAFDVTLEVTHHGPTSMDTPLLFVELGSDEAHWRDIKGAQAVAAAVMECARAKVGRTAAIGFGGPHYASKFNRVVLESDVVVGHIAPKYVIEGLDESLVRQMVTRAAEQVDLAVIDWKGTNAPQKARLFSLLESLGIEVVRASRL